MSRNCAKLFVFKIVRRKDAQGRKQYAMRSAYDNKEYAHMHHLNDPVLDGDSGECMYANAINRI